MKKRWRGGLWTERTKPGGPACEWRGLPSSWGARVCVYGFDLVSPTLAQVILALLPLCQEVALALVLAQNQEARDYSLFWPVERSWTRLEAQAQALALIPAAFGCPTRPGPAPWASGTGAVLRTPDGL